MYEPAQRGTILGIYYLSPLVGPSLGPLIGGGIAASRRDGWRDTLCVQSAARRASDPTSWFLAAYAGVVALVFVVVPETFRHERSTAWQKAIKRAQARVAIDLASRRDADLKAETEHRASCPDAVCGHIETVSGAPATVAIYCHRIRVTTADGTHLSRLQFDDVNPFSAVGATLRSPAILLVTTFSALLFALTCASRSCERS